MASAGDKIVRALQETANALRRPCGVDEAIQTIDAGPVIQVDERPSPGTGFWTAVAMLVLLMLILKMALAVQTGGHYESIGVYVESHPLRPLLQVTLLVPLLAGFAHCVLNLRRTLDFAWVLPMVSFLLVTPALLLGWGAEGPENRYFAYEEREHCAGGGFVPPYVTDAVEPFVAYVTPALVLLSIGTGTVVWFRPDLRAVGVWLALAGLTGIVAWQAAGSLYGCP